MVFLMGIVISLSGIRKRRETQIDTLPEMIALHGSFAQYLCVLKALCSVSASYERSSWNLCRKLKFCSH